MAKGTKANVKYFDGTDGPAKPKRISGSNVKVKLSNAKGTDAGGRESPRNTVKHLRGDAMRVPESGKAHSRPGGVRVHDGRSAGTGAKKPA